MLDMNTAHYTTDNNTAACGRDADSRRVSYALGLELTTAAWQVDCASCQRTKAYKAAMAAKAAKAAAKAAAEPTAPVFMKGDTVAGYNSTAVVLFVEGDSMRVLWATGRECTHKMAARRFPCNTFAFVKVSS
jgi:hypothetical protein